MIRCDRVTYAYPGAERPALRDISVAIEPGEFVLVTGASGAGKSTWLRCLNGLVPHFSGGTIAGQVHVAGHDVLRTGPDRMSHVVGFVFQTPESQAVLSQVEAEIAFGMENAGVPPAEMRRRMEDVLRQLDLVALRHRPQTQLSGGERQRVALAGVLALEPRVLVLDEPTSQLDPPAAARFLDLVSTLRRSLQLTVVLAEHRLSRVWHHATRVLHFEAGRLIVNDTPAAAALHLPAPPPVAALSALFGWAPPPATTAAAAALARALPPPAFASADAAPRSAAPRSAAPPLLAATQVSHKHDGRPALRDVSLRLHSGEIVALMGPNGAGKTTLLKCLIGLETPSESGVVALRGVAQAGRPVVERAREIAYLPQNPDDLLFADTVRDELRLSLANHGITDQVDARIERLLTQLGLSAVAGRYPRDLSVGQRQRTALAVLLVTDPAVLLLDEPTRGVGYQGRRAFAALAEAWRAAGKGVLIATHDVELAARLADRVVILARGAVTQTGAARTVLAQAGDFTPQVAQIFPGRNWLTVEDVRAAYGAATDADQDV